MEWYRGNTLQNEANPNETDVRTTKAHRKSGVNIGNKSLVARVLGFSVKTILKWNKRRKHLNDKKHRPKKSKITLQVELSILALRNTLEYNSDIANSTICNKYLIMHKFKYFCAPQTKWLKRYF